MELRIDVSELAAFGSGMAQSEAVLRGEMAKSAMVALHEGIGYAQENAPVDEGNLRASIRVIDPPSAGGGSYGSDLVYAWMREEGGTIRARNAKALAFMYNGNLVMVKSVTQTGTKYMERSADTLETRLEGIYQLAVDRALGRI